MPYVRPRNTLISRAGYSGVGSWTDTIGDLGKGALTFFGSQQQAVGAANQANLDMQAALRAQQGGGDDTMLILAAGLGLAAFFFLRKKKHP